MARKLFSTVAAGRALFQPQSGKARGVITGLRIGADFIEWNTSRDAKGGGEILASNHAVLAAENKDDPQSESRADQIKRHCAGIAGAVSVGISPARMLMRVAELPTTDPAEMKNMIQLQMDAFSPFPDDRMFVSHETLRSDESGSRVLISAVQKDLIEELGVVLKEAGLDVQRIDAEAMAWWQLISDNAAMSADGRHLLLVMEPWGGVWIMVQQGVPLAFRAVSSPEGMSAAEFAGEVARDAGALVLSIDLEHGSSPLAGVELWTRGGETADLVEAVQAELQHEVTLQSLDNLPRLSEGLTRRFAGTALLPTLTRARKGIAVVDLVPETWRFALIAQRTRRRLLAATFGVLALWMFAMAVFLGTYQFQKYRLARLEAKMSNLQKPADDVRLMQNQMKSFEKYLDRRNSALECLREASQALPKDVLLTSFTFKKGKNIIIRGEALTVNPIYDYKQALDKSQLFGKIEMGNIQPGKRKETNVQTFQMTAKLKEQQ